MSDKIKVQKYTNGGMVAVVYSPGYGAGWASWADPLYEEWCLFDESVVKLVISGRFDDIDALIEETFGPDVYIYTGGFKRKAKVYWLKAGTDFQLNEYDGEESIVERPLPNIYTA